MLTHDQMVRKMLRRPGVKAAYDAQAEEFVLLDELLRARQRAGLTQAEVAKRMGTLTPAVARLEGGGGQKRHSPSIATLRKYARAVGCHLQIKLVPHRARPGERDCGENSVALDDDNATRYDELP